MSVILLPVAAGPAPADAGPSSVVPSAVRRAAAAGLRAGPETLWHRGVAERLVSGAGQTPADLRAMASGDGSACLGGPLGALWAARMLTESAPLGFLVGTARAKTISDTEWWRRQEIELRAPSEAKIAQRMVGLYRLWTARVVELLPDVVGEPEQRSNRRDLATEILDALFNEIQATAELKARLRPVLEQVIRDAFKRTAGDLAVEGVAWAPSILPEDQIIGDKIVNVVQTIKDAVARVVEDGLRDGLSVNAMQDQIKTLPEMSPTRALVVARTETARVVTTGTNAAMQSAAAKGARVKRRWRAATYGDTRPQHLAMNGREASVLEPFTFPDGTITMGPGLSGVAEHDINCRCGLRPVIDRTKK